MILLFDFGLSQLVKAVKKVPLLPHGLRFVSLKAAHARIFSTGNRKWKLLSATGNTPKFGSSP